MKISVILLLSLAVFADCFPATDDDQFLFDEDPVVVIGQGKVKGQPLGGRNSRIDRFLSIPYAEKPINELRLKFSQCDNSLIEKIPNRFKFPVAHKGWGSDTYDASIDLDVHVRKNTCMQIKLSQRGVRGNEDCLYLNVWVNGGVEAARKEPLPVMVWIHGGAFMTGSSWGANFFSNWLYDMEQMVQHGNVVAVSINYRMGPLGFLSTGDSQSPGNYGMLDQVEALKWVKNNIWAFGGDTSKITIFGESAGGASVSFHQISPLSQNLYQRAISQSGTSLSPWAITRDPIRWTKQVAEHVNCTTETSELMMACLQVADAVEMNMAVKMLDLDREVVMDLPFSPVIDGYFLPDEPINLVSNSADKDYLVGHNDMDSHMFVGVSFPAMNIDKIPFLRNDLVKAARIWTYQVPKTVQDMLVDEYEAKSRPVDSEYYKRAVLNLFTDAHFAEPTHNIALLHEQEVKAAGTTSSTYVYVFSHPTKLPVMYMSWMGADHADELQYVFAKPLRNTRVYTEEEQRMSIAFMTYWTNFAWTGDPNSGPNGHIAPAAWKPYKSDTKFYLEINGNLSANGDLALHSDYRSDMMSFWRSSVYQAWNAW